MKISNVYGCAVASLSEFGFDSPWEVPNYISTKKEGLRRELDALLAWPKGAAYPTYCRKLLAVVTDGQQAALQMLREHPQARFISKTMNYQHMNYIFEITTSYHLRERSGDPIPVEPGHIPFKQTIKTPKRKGTRSSKVWNSHVNTKTS